MMEGLILELGEYGRRAVITAPWRDELTRVLVEADIVELELNDGKGWRGEDLSFLKLLPQLQSLKILDLKIRRVDEIHSLPALRELVRHWNQVFDLSSFAPEHTKENGYL